MKRITVLFLFIVLSTAIGQCWTRIWLRMQAYPLQAGNVKLEVECWHSRKCQGIHYQQIFIFEAENRNVFTDNGTIVSATQWGNSIEADFIVLPSCPKERFLEYWGIIPETEYYGDITDNFGNVLYNAIAEPNEGYYLLGFSRSRYKDFVKVERPEDAPSWWEEPYIQYDETQWYSGNYECPLAYPESSFEFNTEIVQHNNHGYMIVPSGQLAHGEFEGYLPKPETPNERCYALFARVKVENSAGGKAKIENHSDEQSDITNDIGDEICITATANDEEHPFQYWIEQSTGRNITENPYTFIVTHQDAYTPYFGIDPSGIEPVMRSDSATHSAIYSLDGKQLNAEPQKGVYIKDGKKITTK